MKTIKLTRAQATRLGIKSAIKREKVGPAKIMKYNGYDKYRTRKIWQ